MLWDHYVGDALFEKSRLVIGNLPMVESRDGLLDEIAAGAGDDRWSLSTLQNRPRLAVVSK